MGPSSISGTRALLNSSSGDPPLDRIFRQNMSTPNMLSVLLSRADDADSFSDSRSSQTGLLSIGEIPQGYESIAYSPKLYAAVDPLGSQHWQTTLDSNGIIGPDGRRIPTPTDVETITVGDKSITTAGGKDQFRVVFDTGFTIPQVYFFKIIDYCLLTKNQASPGSHRRDIWPNPRSEQLHTGPTVLLQFLVRIRAKRDVHVWRS